MRWGLFVSVFAASAVAMLSPGAAGAQDFFGQVKIASEPAPAAAAKPGADVTGVTVTGKRVPDSQRDPKEVLCHNEVPIGSRFPVKVCATREKYAERRADDQEQLREWTALKPYKSN